MRRLAFFLVLLLPAPPASAQLVADTLFSWKGYARTATCRVRIYEIPPQRERTHTVVLTELAENRGPSTVADAQFLAEQVGRRYNLDPTTAYWIVHWGAFSYQNAEPDGDKVLYLRMTFNRTATGRLSSPYWRALRKEDVLELTDRQFRE